jgi:hypothetical protein
MAGMARHEEWVERKTGGGGVACVGLCLCLHFVCLCGEVRLCLHFVCLCGEVRLASTMMKIADYRHSLLRSSRGPIHRRIG